MVVIPPTGSIPCRRPRRELRSPLTAAPRLLLVPVPRGRLLADRLLVRDARRVQLDVDVEAAVQPVDRDFDLHLREAGEELLARLRVPAHLQCRVLLRQTAESRGHL